MLQLAYSLGNYAASQEQFPSSSSHQEAHSGDTAECKDKTSVKTRPLERKEIRLCGKCVCKILAFPKGSTAFSEGGAEGCRDGMTGHRAKRGKEN